jgi:phosphate transport system permease protein
MSTLVQVFLLLIAVVAGGAWSWRTGRPLWPSRRLAERAVHALLGAASTVSIVATLGIVLAVVLGSLPLFREIGCWEFLTGTDWTPRGAIADGTPPHSARFGAVPLFAGTILVTAIAMVTAVPIGVLSAVYLAEYARAPVRRAIVPLLDALAGVPTVVYGYFAAVAVRPLVVDLANRCGLQAAPMNALSPGLVIGVMIIPFLASLSADVITAVPQELRRAAFALGSTRAEVVRQVVLPAAAPGILAAFLLAVSRAVGETMIVVMAAGLQPRLTANPLRDVTTVTAQIVDLLSGNAAANSLHLSAAFGLGLALLVVTLVFHIAAIIAVRWYRD